MLFNKEGNIFLIIQNLEEIKMSLNKMIWYLGLVKSWCALLCVCKATVGLKTWDKVETSLFKTNHKALIYSVCWYDCQVSPRDVWCVRDPFVEMFVL